MTVHRLTSGRLRALVESVVRAGVIVLALAANAPAETLDRVLAVVNGDVITLSDVSAARELGLVGAPAPAGADPMAAVLSALIDRQLELDEVERYAPPEPPVEAVDRGVAAARARFPTAAAFEAALARSGLTLPRLRGWLRDDLRISAYLNQRFSTDDERRRQSMEDWLSGLRRRAEIAELYSTGR